MIDASTRALRLALEAGRQVGLDVADARVFRVRTAVHVELPRADVIARIEARGDEQSAVRQVMIARLLAQRGAPVPELIEPTRQPFLLDEGAITLWHRLRAVGKPGYRELGAAVRAFHDSSSSASLEGLPELDPFYRIRQYLDGLSSWSGPEVCEMFRRRTDELAESWPAAIRDDPLGRVIVHGDVHTENALVTARGVILVDLEDSAVGPASWDFVPPAVAVRRYGLSTDEYSSFAQGYGAEPPRTPAFDLMCEIYELLATTWAMLCSQDSPALAAEASRRVAGMLGESDELWTQQ